MVVVVTTQNFKTKHRATRVAVCVLLVLGPCFASLAALTLDPVVDMIFVPAAMFSHLLFWSSASLLAQWQPDKPREKLDWLSKNADSSGKFGTHLADGSSD